MGLWGLSNRQRPGPVSRFRVRWLPVPGGFIAQDGGGADVFIHYSAITSGGYRELTEGQRDRASHRHVRATYFHSWKWPSDLPDSSTSYSNTTAIPLSLANLADDVS
jgi:'Cold-shock' DNA-binding domain